MTTLLLAEHDNKSLKDATNKALTAAKQMGGDVHVLVAGAGAKPVADAAAKLDGVAKVLLADGAPYEHALAEPLAALIVSLAGNYDAIVAPATRTWTGAPSARAAVSAVWVASLSDALSCSAMRSVVMGRSFGGRVRARPPPPSVSGRARRPRRP